MATMYLRKVQVLASCKAGQASRVSLALRVPSCSEVHGTDGDTEGTNFNSEKNATLVLVLIV